MNSQLSRTDITLPGTANCVFHPVAQWMRGAKVDIVSVRKKTPIDETICSLFSMEREIILRV